MEQFSLESIDYEWNTKRQVPCSYAMARCTIMLILTPRHNGNICHTQTRLAIDIFIFASSRTHVSFTLILLVPGTCSPNAQTYLHLAVAAGVATWGLSDGWRVVCSFWREYLLWNGTNGSEKWKSNSMMANQNDWHCHTQCLNNTID